MNNFIIKSDKTNDIDKSGYFDNINIGFKSTIIDIPMFLFDAEEETTAINSFLAHKIDPITHEICKTITLDSNLIKLHANGYFYLDKTNLSVLFDVNAYYYLEISNGNKIWNSQIFKTITIPIATFNINSFIANDYIEGLDSELSATFNATATGKGLATFNFTWDFGAQQVTTTIQQSVSVGDTVILNPTAIAPSGVTSGAYTLTVSGSVSDSDTFNYTIPVKITVNKTDVSFDFNDNVKILWGDGNVSQGSGTGYTQTTYTHTYSSIPQTMTVYNFVDGNNDLLNNGNTGAIYVWDAEISNIIAPQGTKLIAKELDILNTLDNNFNLNLADAEVYQLKLDNITQINLENNTFIQRIGITDTLRTLTKVYLKNCINLTFIGDAFFGQSIRLWQSGNNHNIDYIDFSGTKIENGNPTTKTSDSNKMFFPNNNLTHENIIGNILTAWILYYPHNNFGASITYIDFTVYSNWLDYIDLSNNNLSQIQVDEYCKRIRDHAVNKNVTNGLLNINNNTAPSATGLTYINELVNTYGWTVNHD